jgi:hypothetical protein
MARVSSALRMLSERAASNCEAFIFLVGGVVAIAIASH